ncbi:MAG: malate synthase A, partial [Actinobacteria bacterium]|nr:malate synthase A [Actinomycetota bacterium]
MTTELIEGVEVEGPAEEGFDAILTDDAVAFVAGLQREFNPRRKKLLSRRAERQAELDSGATLDFLPATEAVRNDDWKVSPAPGDLQDRRVEITGPTDRKMVINALNSGAKGFMADFEDSNSPTWHNMTGGHLNLIDAIDGSIDFTGPDGKGYRLDEEVATMLVRPRGWHLPEKHIKIDGEPLAGALCDFGLFLFHNAKRLIDKGSGPYFYLP